MVDRCFRRFWGFARRAVGLKLRGAVSHRVSSLCTPALDPSTCEEYFAKHTLL